jgi:peptidyl-prolyl cis-trans isomerase SurA
MAIKICKSALFCLLISGNVILASTKTETAGKQITTTKERNFSSAYICVQINKDAITKQDIEDRSRLLLFFSEMPFNSENINLVRSQATQNLILETLQIQIAKDFEIEASAKEIENSFENLSKQNGKSAKEFKEILEGNMVSIKSLENRLKAQLVWIKYIKAKFSSIVKVSNREVELAIERIKANQKKQQYEIMEIVLYGNNYENEKNASDILSQLNAMKGLNFKAVAQQISQSPNSITGGYVGWQADDQIDPITKEVLEQMKVGEIKIVKTNNAYKIIKLKDKKMPNQASFGSTKISYCQFFIPIPSELTAEEEGNIASKVEEIKSNNNHKSLVDDMLSKGVKAAFIEEKPLNELPDALRTLILPLGVNQITEPLRDGDNLIIFKVCAKKVVTQEELPTPDQMREILSQEQFSKLAEREVNLLKNTSFIKYS